MGERNHSSGGRGRRNRRVWIASACVAALVVAILVARAWLSPPTRYAVAFLEIPDADVIHPYGINDHGQVVGRVFRAEGEDRIFFWDPNDGARDLGSYDNPKHQERLLINNARLIAGSRKDTKGHRRAFVRELEGKARLLESLGGPRSEARGLNNRGEVAGFSETPAGEKHAVLWDAAGALNDLGTLGGKESLACSVNDSGHVAGYSQIRSGLWHAFFWDPNTGIADLGVASVEGVSNAIHVNNCGLVVGRFGSASDKVLLSAWSRATGARILPRLRVREAYPQALNSPGQSLVDTWSDAGLWDRLWHRSIGHDGDFVWDPNEGYLSLNNSLGRRHVRRARLRDINDRGQITGNLWLGKERNPRGVVLEPIRERRRK